MASQLGSPKFGVILASASYDGKVLIWREENRHWNNIHQHAVHKASVNSISWAPQEYGALLLCASSDGFISVVEFKDEGKYDHIIVSAHSFGVNAVSWAPQAFLDLSFNLAANNRLKSHDGLSVVVLTTVSRFGSLILLRTLMLSRLL